MYAGYQPGSVSEGTQSGFYLDEAYNPQPNTVSTTSVNITLNPQEFFIARTPDYTNILIDVFNVMHTVTRDAYNYWYQVHGDYITGNNPGGHTCPNVPPPHIILPIDPERAWEFDIPAIRAMYLTWLQEIGAHNWTENSTLDLSKMNMTNKYTWIKADLDLDGDNQTDLKGGYFIPTVTPQPFNVTPGVDTQLPPGTMGMYWNPDTGTGVPVVAGGGGGGGGPWLRNVQGWGEPEPHIIDTDRDGRNDTVVWTLNNATLSNTTDSNVVGNLTNSTLTLGPAPASNYTQTVPQLPPDAWNLVSNVSYMFNFSMPNLDLTGKLHKLFEWFSGLSSTKKKLVLAGAGLFVLLLIAMRPTRPTYIVR